MRLPENRKVGGSTPPLATARNRRSAAYATCGFVFLRGGLPTPAPHVPSTRAPATGPRDGPGPGASSSRVDRSTPIGSAAEGGMRAADVHLPAVHAKHPQPEVRLA